MTRVLPTIATLDVESWLDILYVAAEGAGLRDEERKKAVEVAPLLVELARVVARASARRPITLVDAAAGKAYVGLLAARLVLDAMQRPGSVVTIERDPARVAATRAAVGRLGSRTPIECKTARVADRASWPPTPAIVVALHACGSASDDVIDAAIAADAGALLLVPCCYGRDVPVEASAGRAGERLGVPRHALVRRRFAEALVGAERTLRLEKAGYETEVVELCSPTATPHNLLWRARRVREKGRMREAARRHERLRRFLDGRAR